MASKMLFGNLLCTSLFLFVYSNAIKAQAPVGGEISYTYLRGLGEYEVTLVMYQSARNAMKQPIKVVLRSTCYGTDTLLMKSFVPAGMTGTSSGGVRFSADVHCGDTVASDSLQPLAFFYRDTIALPGRCQDYTFIYRQCCRDSVIDNMVQPENTTFYLSAKLSNLWGENTSPKFLDLPRYRFYKGVVSQDYGLAVIEPDNDSVWHRLISAKDSAGNNVSYASGYSAAQPYPSQFSYEYGIAPTQAGEYTVVMEAKEYRYDTALAMWAEVGNTIREITYFVEDSFPASAVSSAFGEPGVMDTIRNVYCDTIVSFAIEPFYLPSLALEGSQFRLIGMDSLARPVVAAGCFNVDTALMCDSVWLKLHKQPAINDSFFIHVQAGGGLVNACGNEFVEGVLDYMVLTGCPQIGLKNNVPSSSFLLYPNPATDKIIVVLDEGEIPDRIKVSDLQGRELLSFAPASSSIEVDVSKFTSGVYLINIEIDGRTQSKLFQKP